MNFNNDRPSNEEILQALQILKKLCLNSACADCPCEMNGDCLIQRDPVVYQLNGPEEKWKAFKE